MDWYSTPQRPAAALGASDIERMVSCCPGLDVVQLSVQSHITLSALGQLPALRHLYITHVENSAAFESMRPLSRLSGLRHMQVDLSGRISQQSLLALTAVTALTSLYVGPVINPEFQGAGDIDVSMDGNDDYSVVRTWLDTLMFMPPACMCS
jgi:hypothetical protein